MKKQLIALPVLILQACTHNAQSHISQQDLLQQLNHDSLVIVDVRSTAEFQTGHIPKARHIPFWRAFTTEQLQQYPSTQPLVIYCEHGPRAGVAKLGLWLQGFTDIRYLEGHMTTWRKSNLPLEH